MHISELANLQNTVYQVTSRVRRGMCDQSGVGLLRIQIILRNQELPDVTQWSLQFLTIVSENDGKQGLKTTRGPFY